MARVIAIVTELSGKFFAKDAKGNSVELQKGDEIFEGMIVYGDSANGASDTIHIHAYSGEEIMLASNQEQLFDVTMVDAEVADLDAVIAEESIAAIIAENTPQKTQEEEEEDIFEEETAAGDEKAKKDADVAGDFAAREGNMADVSSDLRNTNFKAKSRSFEIKSAFEREDDHGVEAIENTTTVITTLQRPTPIVNPIPSPIAEQTPTKTPENIIPPVTPEPTPQVEAPAVSITINDITVNEATGTASVTITLSNPSTNPITVDYATSDNTTEGSDYTSGSGTITFAPNETSKTIEIPISNDGVYEGSETLYVNLSNATGGATIGDAQGVITIKDDGTGTGGNNNDQPQMSINDVTVEEGSKAIFTVTVGAAESPYTVTFNTTTNGTAEDTDITAPIVVKDAQGNTIVANQDGSYTVPANTTSLTVEVPTVVDGVYEGSETFELNGKTEFMSSNVSGTGTIKDDGSANDGDDNDGTIDNDQPQMSINDVTVEEGSKAIFTVTVGAAESPYTVTFNTTTNGTAEDTDITAPIVVKDAQGNTIVANQDGSYTVPANTTSLTVEVPTVVDGVYEGSETFELNGKTEFMSSNVSGTGTIKDDGSANDGDDNDGTIDNDQPQMSINDVTVEEGSKAIFTVTVGAAESPYTVTFNTTTNGTAEDTDITAPIVVKDAQGNTIVANQDGSYTVPANTTSLTVEVPTVVDGVYEGSETFELNGKTEFMSSNVSGTGTIKDDGSANDGDDNDGTIDNDMPSVSITLIDAHAVEGTTNDTIVFAVSQSNVSDFDTTVQINLDLNEAEVADIVSLSYTDTDGVVVTLSDTAAINDFVTNGATVKIESGQTSAPNITITVADDTDYERSETIGMSIANPTNAVLSSSTSAVGTIFDEDSTNPNTNIDAPGGTNPTDKEGDAPILSLKSNPNHTVTFFDPDTVKVVEGKLEISTNLVVTLDVSGSMKGDRLALAKESLVAVINQYKAEGTTYVNLTTFSSNGNNIGWMDADTAINTINNLSTSGYTNYEAAIKETTQNIDFTNYQASRTIAFFISDGDPTQELKNDGTLSNTNTSNVMNSLDGTSGNNKGVTVDGETYGRIDQVYYDMWKDFTTNQTNGVETTTIGLGSGLSSAGEKYLNMMAGAYGGEALFVEDSVLELTAALSPTEVIEGNIFDLVESDSNINIDSITVGGTTYTTSLTDVAIDGKGKFSIDFTTGEYSYTVKKNEFDTDSTKSFVVKVSDESANELEFDVDMHIFTFHPTITGDANDNEIIYNATAIIDGGDGDDTLVLLSNQGLDFNNQVLEVATIQNIEVIGMENDFANNLQNLTLADVIAITSNSNELVIDGDSADSVTFKVGETGWVKGASDGTYTTYTNTTDASVTLKIDDDIQQPIM